MANEIDSRARTLISISDGLYAEKLPILSLWQSICEQFYVERADYTYVRSIGMEFGSHLMTGLPAMASRDLANQVGAMLRPPGQVWFHPRTQSEPVNRDTDALRWLDWAGERMRLAMYDNRSGFVRAMKEADRDFVTIGNACVSIRTNEVGNGLLFRTHHMRDVAWTEDYAGRVDGVHLKEKISVRNMCRLFPKTVSETVRKMLEKEPNREFNCRRIVVPTMDYENRVGPIPQTGYGSRKLPNTSIWVDIENETMLEEIGQWALGYMAARWSTVPGYKYGYAPPTTINISDARMLQQITLTLLEAGQKAVDPPMKAVAEMVQGGINMFAGGVSWVDADYDERTGPAIEALLKTQPNLGWGVDREKRIGELIAQGHYLNQIKLPDTTHAQTAYEVQKLWEEYIRTATPLFEPIEVEENASVCDQVFTTMLRANGFGPIMQNMPQILQGQDVKFSFDSPLTVAATRANAQAFTSVLQLTQGAVALDPTLSRDIDADVAFRDALYGSGAPATWIVPKDLADKMKAADRAKNAQQQQQQQQINQVSQGADVASKIGNAADLLQRGGIMPPPQIQNGGKM